MKVHQENEARVHCTISKAAELPETLNTAVQKLLSAADDDMRKGILITRQRPGHYLVELSDDVPYGIIQQRYAD